MNKEELKEGYLKVNIQDTQHAEEDYVVVSVMSYNGLKVFSVHEDLIDQLDEPKPLLSGKNKLRNQVGRLINDRYGKPDEKSRIERQAYLNVHNLIDQPDEPEEKSPMVKFSEKMAMLGAAIKESNDRENAEAELALLGYKVVPLDEPEKPVIPSFVAEWIEKKREKGYTLRGVFSCMEEVSPYDKSDDYKVSEWVGGNRKRNNGLARAWLDGYTVEEQKYVLPVDENHALCKFANDAWGIYKENADKLYLDDDFKFTEQEIKDYDERFWPFAKEVQS